MALKVLFVPMYPIQRASSRYRVYQYLPGLRERGVDVRVVEAPAGGVRARVSHTLGLLRGAAEADVVVAQKRTLWQIIHLVRAVNRNLVYDFDDALYVAPEAAGRGAGQASGRRVRSGLDAILRLSRQVIAGNRYLAAYARRYNEQVTVIPTVLDLRRYRVHHKPPGGPVVLGWVGDPSNLVYLELLAPALDELGRRWGDRIALQVISSRPFEAHLSLPVINRPWRLESEIEDLWDFDIGLMPLSDNEWTRGKCAFKALQYMALEIPAVVSPVGVNADVVVDGINGFLADSEREWRDRLERLITDVALRRRLGAAGRQTVRARFALDVALPVLEAVLRRAAGETVPGGREMEVQAGWE